VYPEIVSIGPITLHSFGLMLAIAFLLGSHLYTKELVRRGLDPSLCGTALTGGIIGGLVGARLYYVIEFWDETKGDLLGALVSASGLVAYGGFAGALTLAWIMLHRRGAPLLEATDAVAPLLALGYAIGRIGCLLAGDGDYGPPTDLPWGMSFPNGVVPTLTPVHPTPIYETLVMSAVFVLLWRMRLRPWKTGRLFALYLFLAGAERFVMEFWRTNPAWALGLSGAQFIAAGSALVGAVWFVSAAGEASPG